MLELIQSYEYVFLCPKWSICQKQNFFSKTINISFIYLLALSLRKILKKILELSQSYEDVSFLGPKWSICLEQQQKNMVKVKEKFLLQTQSFEDVPFLGLK